MFLISEPQMKSLAEDFFLKMSLSNTYEQLIRLNCYVSNDGKVFIDRRKAFAYVDHASNPANRFKVFTINDFTNYRMEQPQRGPGPKPNFVNYKKTIF